MIEQKSNKSKLLGVVKSKESELVRALPSHLNAKSIVRAIQTEISQNKQIQECDPISFLKCVFQSAQLGLIPGPLGHVYLIPYKGICTLQIGYKGMIDIAMRSGKVNSIYAECVFENDDYEIEYGLERKCYHKPNLFNERGKVVGAYAIASFNREGKHFVYLTSHEIEKIRGSVKTFNKTTPWETHYEEMAKKTAIRRLFKYLPVSLEMNHAINLDEKTEYDSKSQQEYIDSNIDVNLEVNEKDRNEELKEIINGASTEVK